MRIDGFERFYWRYCDVDGQYEVNAARPVGDELEMLTVEVFADEAVAVAFVEFLFDSVGCGMHKMSHEDFANTWYTVDEYIGLEEEV